jgi:hypothetical protein
MNSAPEEFNQLRNLLALKRHEQPPPGFFDHFSDKVIARIEAEGLVRRSCWWQRVFPDLDAKPVLACAYGVLITGLLVVGLGVSQSLESEEGTAPEGSPWFAQTPAPTASPPPSTAATRPLTEQTDSVSSVNAVFTRAPRFLFEVNQLKVDKATYNQ